jgi:hypothetical protein
VVESPDDDLALQGAAVVCEYHPWSIRVREGSRRGWGEGDEKWAVNATSEFEVYYLTVGIATKEGASYG